MNITNATKAALIGVVTAVIGLLPTFGVSLNPHTETKILVITTVVLSGLAWFTRQLSPKWSNLVNTIEQDVITAAEDIVAAAQVIEAAAADIKNNTPPAVEPTKATKTKKA